MAESAENKLDHLRGATDEMVKTGLAVTKEWMSLWRDGLNYIFNNQLYGKNRKDGWERIQANYIYPAMMQEMAISAQRRPKIIAEPWEPDDQQHATVWQSHLQWLFEKGLRMPFLNLAASLDGKIYGYYVAKVRGDPEAEWDETTKQWKWAPEVNLIAPEFFGADPDCENIQKGAWVFSHRRILVKQAQLLWPKFAKEIKEGAEKDGARQDANVATWGLEAKLDQTDPDSPQTNMEGRLVALLAKARGFPRAREKDSDGKERTRYTTLSEIYWKDPERVPGQETEDIPVEELQEQGAIVADDTLWRIRDASRFRGKKRGDLVTMDVWPQRVIREWSAPKYPRGRHLIRTGRTILNPDEKDQVYKYRQWPYVVGVNAILPHVWQGMNGVEGPKGLQDWVNVSMAHMCNYVKYFGDPVTLVEHGALAGDPNNQNIAAKIKAKAGALIKLAANGMAKFKRLDPPNLGAGVPTIHKMVVADLQDQTGIHESGRGRQTPGKTTATEIMQQTTSTQRRTAIQIILLDDWNVRTMELVSEMTQKNMRADQILRVVGEKNARRVAEITQEMLSAHYDLRMSVTSVLPMDKERGRQNAERLFEIFGPAVAENVLDAFDVPDKEKILSRYQAWLDLQQWIEQQDQQQAQGATA